jgi:hypothetical protein
MGDEEKRVPLRKQPRPGKPTPVDLGLRNTKPADQERTSPFPYADDFESWVADETADGGGSDDR